MNKFKCVAASAAIGLFAFTSCGKKAVVEKDLGPAETVTYVSNSLAEGKTAEAWVCLPKSYRQQITESLHKIGNKMPPEIWDKSFELVGRLGKVLKSKQSLIGKSASDMGAKGNQADMNKSISSFGDALVELANSDLAKVSKLKSINMQDFAADTGKKIAKLLVDKNPLLDSIAKEKTKSSASDNLKKIQAKLISEKGNTAKVKIKALDGTEEEVEMTKVEGKWLPKDLVAEVEEMSKNLKKLDNFLDMAVKNKDQISAQIKMVEGIISAIEKANKPEDLMAAVKQTPLGMFMGGAAGGPATKPNK